MKNDPAAEAIVQLAQAGRLREAETACRKLRRSRPHDGPLLALNGQILLALGDAPLARKLLLEMASSRPFDPGLAFHAVSLLRDSGDLEGAALLLRRLVTLMPSSLPLPVRTGADRGTARRHPRCRRRL